MCDISTNPEGLSPVTCRVEILNGTVVSASKRSSPCAKGWEYQPITQFPLVSHSTYRQRQMTVTWDAQVREMLNNLLDMNPSPLIFILAYQIASYLRTNTKHPILIWNISWHTTYFSNLEFRQTAEMVRKLSSIRYYSEGFEKIWVNVEGPFELQNSGLSEVSFEHLTLYKKPTTQPNPIGMELSTQCHPRKPDRFCRLGDK